MYITIWEEFDKLCEKMWELGYILKSTDNTGDLEFIKYENYPLTPIDSMK